MRIFIGLLLLCSVLLLWGHYRAPADPPVSWEACWCIQPMSARAPTVKVNRWTLDGVRYATFDFQGGPELIVGRWDDRYWPEIYAIKDPVLRWEVLR